jgi:multiple sugar transport system substrate-binding protein
VRSNRRLGAARPAVFALLLATACADRDDAGVLTISGSAVGAEADVLRAQIERFTRGRPGLRVELRATPDAADQRHQLYVQWLNARASEPDVLQLDVIWTPEFAAAGWILALDTFAIAVDSFFPATIAANRWRGRLFAVPWFVDVGMLYWRTDLMNAAPSSFAELTQRARAAQQTGMRYGLVWQGARYEGLVTVFLEYLGAFGGAILDASGRVTVADAAAVRALVEMQQEIETGLVPRAALSWQEEQTRFAFQNGEAAFMRNWPYAYALLSDTVRSRVAGRFAVAPMPAGAGGASAAALGGAQLAVNAHSREPRAAIELIAFLTQPAQMLERARVAGQFPTRPALYETEMLAQALAIPPAQARRVIERATPRPVTPVYTELSQILQLHLHRALSGQQSAESALRAAASQMRALLERVQLIPPDSTGGA